jgi:hypothetical protein
MGPKKELIPIWGMKTDSNNYILAEVYIYIPTVDHTIGVYLYGDLYILL